MGIEKQIQILGEKIDYISQNTQFTITVIVAVIGVSIAIAGVALYKLSRAWVNKAVQDELEVIKKELKEESQKFILDNESYVIKAWDNAFVSQGVTRAGETVYFIPVHADNENLINPPIISLYRKNKNGDKELVKDYFLVSELESYDNKENKNILFICIKDIEIGYGLSYVVMWEKAKENETFRL